MGNSTTSTKKRLVPNIAFGVGLARGIAAIAAGLLLIFYPDKSRAMLGNMMGLFWLFSGIALLRRSQDDSLVKMVGGRTSKIIAVIGILAGLLVVTRSLSRQVVPEGTLIILLGFVIMLTGVMHALAEIRVGNLVSSKNRVLHLILGIFEIVFGATLILSPLDRSPASYWIATIWALIFGVLVIGDTVTGYMTRRKQKDDGDSATSGQTDENKAAKNSALQNPTDDKPVDEAGGSLLTASKVTEPNSDPDPVPSVKSS